MSTCPRCNTPLTATDYQGVALQACTQCGGRWLSHDELKTVLDTLEAPQEVRAPEEGTPTSHRGADPSGKKDLPCPDCGRAMEPFNYAGDSGVILDKCPHCDRLWLDAGQLEQVQKAVQLSRQDIERDMKRFSATLHEVEVREDRREQEDTRATPVPTLAALASRRLDPKSGV